MKRFAAFETSAVTARLRRLARTEQTLRERIAAREIEVVARGGWVRTDALHRHLTAVLITVRKALDETRQEAGRREDVPGRVRSNLDARVEA